MKKGHLVNAGKTNPNEPKRTQNEPNFKNAKMNVSYYITKGYENKSNWAICENKPNPNPISQKAQMNLNLFATKHYKNQPPWGSKSNQTQCRNSTADPPSFGGAQQGMFSLYFQLTPPSYLTHPSLPKFPILSSSFLPIVSRETSSRPPTGHARLRCNTTLPKVAIPLSLSLFRIEIPRPAAMRHVHLTTRNELCSY